MLKLRTDVAYVKPDGKLTQAGVEAIQGQLDANASASSVAALDARLTTVETATSFIKLQAAITASGRTTIEFTGVPSWAKRLNVMMRGLSLSGTDNLLVQVGNGGSYITTGYSAASESAAGTAQGAVDSSVGFIMFTASAARAAHGAMTLMQFASGEWVSTHNFWVGSGAMASGGGSIAGVGTLTRVRIAATGANTFDAGSVSISWE